MIDTDLFKLIVWILWPFAAGLFLYETKLDEQKLTFIKWLFFVLTAILWALFLINEK